MKKIFAILATVAALVFVGCEKDGGDNIGESKFVLTDSQWIFRGGDVIPNENEQYKAEIIIDFGVSYKDVATIALVITESNIESMPVGDNIVISMVKFSVTADENNKHTTATINGMNMTVQWQDENNAILASGTDSSTMELTRVPTPYNLDIPEFSVSHSQWIKEGGSDKAIYDFDIYEEGYATIGISDNKGGYRFSQKAKYTETKSEDGTLIVNFLDDSDNLQASWKIEEIHPFEYNVYYAESIKDGVVEYDTDYSVFNRLATEVEIYLALKTRLGFIGF